MDFNEDRKVEREVVSILDYFKLIYLEKLTYGKNVDTFKLFEGDLLYKKVLNDEEEGLISLDSTNADLINDLSVKSDKITKLPHSLSTIHEKQFNNLGWLQEIVECVDAEVSARDTIVGFSNFGTYNEESVFEIRHK